MEKRRLEFFKKYMATICPTGYEEEASRVWCEEAGQFADRTWVDLHGLGDGVPPNFLLNVADLQRVLWGIGGQQYLDSPEHLSPFDCP